LVERIFQMAVEDVAPPHVWKVMSTRCEIQKLSMLKVERMFPMAVEDVAPPHV
jgi:hypothetical protein